MGLQLDLRLAITYSLMPDIILQVKRILSHNVSCIGITAAYRPTPSHAKHVKDMLLSLKTDKSPGPDSSGAGSNLKVEGHNFRREAPEKFFLLCPTTFSWCPPT